MDNVGRLLVLTMLKETAAPAAPPGRLLSIDLFRGVVMFLLIGEATGLYELLLSPLLDGTALHSIGIQFQHHPWEGSRLWDLGQPFFMIISGVAMVFSYEKGWQRGDSWAATLGRAASRATVLLILGWALARITPLEIGTGWDFVLDILPQLAVAGFVGFLLLMRSSIFMAFSALCLFLMTELLYRLWSVPGFDEPFVAGHNFGSYVDQSLFGQAFEGSWVAFNLVPSIVFVIVGIMAGRLLKCRRSPRWILKILSISGFLGVAEGIALSLFTPIIRRLCTSSFVILAVGLGLLALALAYWMVDIIKIRYGTAFFYLRRHESAFYLPIRNAGRRGMVQTHG